MITIERLKQPLEMAYEDVSELATELHNEPRYMSAFELGAFLDNPKTRLMIVRDGERVVGMATLYVIEKIAKKGGLIEDVIISEKYRGQGLGKRLMVAVIDEARTLGLKDLTISSGHNRAAAHHLYEKLGFAVRNTNVFRLTL